MSLELTDICDYTPDSLDLILRKLQRQLREQIKYNQQLSEENEELRKLLHHYLQEREMSKMPNTWERYVGG